ncbi:MAG: cytochrome c oxidase subunit 3 [candidate division NC10 bacterium]|nr:cytochrome c oxidase subunit 3 [candidate division NC10 bacterium]
MSQVAVAHPGVEPAESPLTPESWGKLGMWMFLVGDAMSFGGLLAGYGALRFGSADWPVPSNVLGVPLTALMTFLLICSSVTMVKALAAIRKGDRRGLRNFLLLTILGGLTFLGLQAYEWTHLITEILPPKGLTFTRHLFGTTFFVLTGFHGMHVTGGVIYLSCIVMQGVRGKYSRDRWEPVELVGLYWHFVDLVWILIFTFVYLL